jgi:hypothetical protein
MQAAAMPCIRLAWRRQTPALSERNEVHWPRPRNFQARNGDQDEAQSLPPVLRRRLQRPISTEISMSRS